MILRCADAYIIASTFACIHRNNIHVLVHSYPVLSIDIHGQLVSTVH